MEVTFEVERPVVDEEEQTISFDLKTSCLIHEGHRYHLVGAHHSSSIDGYQMTLELISLGRAERNG